jgi:hypothetical protein
MLRRLVLTALWLAVVLTVPLSPPASTAGDNPGTLYVSPTGDGRRDGSNWENAAALPQLPVLLPRIGAGGRVLLRADMGAYKVLYPVALSRGGAPQYPITFMGVDGAGNPTKAVIVGTRTEPYSPSAAPGSEVFRLLRGADHLRFMHLTFRNQGNGCLRIASDIQDLTIENVDAYNVRRFIEDTASETAKSASISGLVIRNVNVTGFSKSAIRLRYNTRNVLIEDVTGDSERQDGDDFAVGVALEGTVHDVVLRRVTMRNSHDTLHEYWNGDGFSTERDVYRIRFEDTVASGNTDAGYDLKSSDTVLERAISEDNKHNFKFWGRQIVVSNCIGRNPHIRGGTGVQDQFEILEGADISITGCQVDDSDARTTVFHVDGNARAQVKNTIVSKHLNARMSLVQHGGILLMN